MEIYETFARRWAKGRPDLSSLRSFFSLFASPLRAGFHGTLYRYLVVSYAPANERSLLLSRQLPHGPVSFAHVEIPRSHGPITITRQIRAPLDHTDLGRDELIVDARANYFQEPHWVSGILSICELLREKRNGFSHFSFNRARKIVKICIDIRVN